jgi:hypothetical protein
MRWIEARRAELLPTPYFHTVFTLPHELNPLVLANKRRLLALLFQSASETLLDFGKRRLHGQLGAIMILHTWDQRLKPHFHVHALVPGGALAHQGQAWNPTKATYLFPVKALSTVFRAKFRDGLKALYAEQALRLTDATSALETPRAFNQFVKRLCQKQWVVYAKAPFEYPSYYAPPISIDIPRGSHLAKSGNGASGDALAVDSRLDIACSASSRMIQGAPGHTWVAGSS